MERISIVLRFWIGKAPLLAAMGLGAALASAEQAAEPSESAQAESADVVSPLEIAEEVEAIVVETEQETPYEARAAEDPVEDKTERKNVGEIVGIMQNTTLAENQRTREMVTVFGSSHMKGEVGREYVTIFGNSRMEGSVGREMVTVFGNAYVDGRVDREVVVIFGNLELGPNADVGELTVFGGQISESETATVRGDRHEITMFFGKGINWDEIHPYFYEGVFLGRLIVPSITWTWWIAGIALLFVALIAAAFPKPSLACIKALETKAALSVVSGVGFILLGGFVISIIFLLLAATVIGVVAVPFIIAILIFAWIMGFVSTYGLIGRNFGAKNSVALAVLLGGAVLTALYAVPILGMLVFCSISCIGFGAVMVASMQANAKKRNERVSRPAPAKPAQAVPAIPAQAGNEPSPVASSPEQEGVQSIPVGFLPRFGASLLDLVVLSVAVHIIDSLPMLRLFSLVDNFLLIWAAYHVGFWTWKGTTLGGVVLGLRIERLDGEKLSFGVCLIRALASLLSFFCLGLGFFWASWDENRQSWHDKIAGTVIARVPKGFSLI